MNKSVIVLANITNVHTHRFIREFKNKGWIVHVISIQPPNEENMNEFGDSIIKIPTYSIYNYLVKLPFLKYSKFHNINSGVRWFEPYTICSLITYLYLIVSIKKIVSRLSANAIFSIYLTMHGFLAILSRHKNVIASAAGTDIARHKKYTLKYWANHPSILRYTINRCAHVIGFDQESHQSVLEDKKCHTDNLIWLNHWGVDADKFHFDIERIKETPRTCRLICSRPFRSEFDIENILLAFKTLHSYNSNIELIIASGARSDTNLSLLYSIIEKTGCSTMDSILVKKHIPYEELPNLLSKCDIYIDPINIKKCPETADWGVSGSLLEAMASGIIPVVSQRPSINWILPEETNQFIFEDFRTDLLPTLHKATLSINNIKLRKLIRNSIVEKANWQRNISRIESLLLANGPDT